MATNGINGIYLRNNGTVEKSTRVRMLTLFICRTSCNIYVHSTCKRSEKISGVKRLVNYSHNKCIHILYVKVYTHIVHFFTENTMEFAY